MGKFEYRVLRTEQFSLEDLEKVLNSLGCDGWEVSAVPSPGSLIFQRCSSSQPPAPKERATDEECRAYQWGINCGDPENAEDWEADGEKAAFLKGCCDSHLEDYYDEYYMTEDQKEERDRSIAWEREYRRQEAAKAKRGKKPRNYSTCKICGEKHHPSKKGCKSTPDPPDPWQKLEATKMREDNK